MGVAKVAEVAKVAKVAKAAKTAKANFVCGGRFAMNNIRVHCSEVYLIFISMDQVNYILDIYG
jgi:hypothetical protein